MSWCVQDRDQTIAQLQAHEKAESDARQADIRKHQLEVTRDLSWAVFVLGVLTIVFCLPQHRSLKQQRKRYTFWKVRCCLNMRGLCA